MKTLKSLVTSYQPSQIQGVNRTHWGHWLQGSVTEKSGNRMSYRERKPQALLYSGWKYGDTTENVLELSF